MQPKYWKDSELVSSSSLEKLSQFTHLILHWNQKVNLTGYKSYNDVDELLIGESVLAAEALWGRNLLFAGMSVLDFGSGAGIPGLVWCMLDLPIELTSLEIRQKKVAFQKEVVRDLSLKCAVQSGRFPEDVATSKFDLIVSRAIRYDPRIWNKGKKCLAPSGKFVRFAAGSEEAPGWISVPVSERTSILIQG